MKEICDVNLCTGCYSCVNACPFGAIDMVEDELGFFYPKINHEKCRNCGLCRRKCPQLNKVEYKSPKNAYAAFTNDRVKRAESTSGGLASVFYEYILEETGVVYGVSSVIEDGCLNYIRVDDKKNIQLLKGSKYVQALVKDVFKLVLKDLNNKKLVLFIGTPCQVAGLKLFLGKDYKNLYLVDIICHGVPSIKLLFNDLDKFCLKEFDKVLFRGDDGYRLRVYFKNKTLIDVPSDDDYYYKSFLNGTIFRKSCYSCKYAKINRITDITIGDFWGLGDDCNFKTDENKGISLVMPLTEKGNKLFEAIKHRIIFEERTIEEAMEGNSQLQHPVKVLDKRLKFEKMYKKYGYYKAMKKMRTLKEVLKENKYVYFLYKKIRSVLK